MIRIDFEDGQKKFLLQMWHISFYCVFTAFLSFRRNILKLYICATCFCSKFGILRVYNLTISNYLK